MNSLVANAQRQIGLGLALAIIALSSVVLIIGWGGEQSWIVRWRAWGPAMVPSTSICFNLMASAYLFQQSERARSRSMSVWLLSAALCAALFNALNVANLSGDAAP